MMAFGRVAEFVNPQRDRLAPGTGVVGGRLNIVTRVIAGYAESTQAFNVRVQSRIRRSLKGIPTATKHI